MASTSLNQNAAFDPSVSPPPPPWPIRRSVLSPFAALASGLALTLALVTLPLPHGSIRFLGGAISALTATLFAAFSRLPIVDRLRLRRGAFDVRDTALLTAAVTTASIAFVTMFGFSSIGFAPGGPSLARVAAIACVTAVGEELLFRGYIQPRLEERWGSRAAVLVTAAIFCAWQLDARQAALGFALGLAFGWSASRARSTRPALVAHAVARTVTALCVAIGAFSL